MKQPTGENTSSPVPRRGFLARYVDRFRQEPPSSREARSTARNSTRGTSQDGTRRTKPVRLGSASDGNRNTKSTGTAFCRVSATKPAAASDYEKNVKGYSRTDSINARSRYGIGSNPVGLRETAVPALPGEVMEDEEMLRQLTKLRTALGKHRQSSHKNDTVPNRAAIVAIAGNSTAGEQPDGKGKELSPRRIETFYAAHGREDLTSQTARTSLGMFDSLSTRSSVSSSNSSSPSSNSSHSKSNISSSKLLFNHRKPSAGSVPDIHTETAELSDNNTSNTNSESDTSSFQRSPLRNKNDRHETSWETKDEILAHQKSHLANISRKSVPEFDDDRLDIQTERLLGRIGALSHSKPININSSVSVRSMIASTIPHSSQVISVCPSAVDASQRSTVVVSPNEILKRNPQEVLDELRRRYGLNQLYDVADANNANEEQAIPPFSILQEPMEIISTRPGQWNRVPHIVGGKPPISTNEHNSPFKSEIDRPLESAPDRTLIKLSPSQYLKKRSNHPDAPYEEIKIPEKYGSNRAQVHAESSSSSRRTFPPPETECRISSARNRPCLSNSGNKTCKNPKGEFRDRRSLSPFAVLPTQNLPTAPNDGDDDESAAENEIVFKDMTMSYERNRTDTTERSECKCRSYLERETQTDEFRATRSRRRTQLDFDRLDKSSFGDLVPEGAVRTRHGRGTELSKGCETPYVLQMKGRLRPVAHRETSSTIEAPESRAPSQERDAVELWTVSDPVGNSTIQAQRFCGVDDVTNMDTSPNVVLLGRPKPAFGATSERQAQEVPSGATCTEKQAAAGSRAEEQLLSYAMPYLRSGNPDANVTAIGDKNVGVGSPGNCDVPDPTDVENRGASPKMKVDSNNREENRENRKNNIFGEDDRGSEAEVAETRETNEKSTEAVVSVDDMLHLLRERLRGFEDEFRLVDAEIYDLEVLRMINAAM